MTSSSRNPFTTIRTEGALLPVDLLQRIVAGDGGLGGLTPESYHLAGNEKLNEIINRAWNRLLGAWAAFQTSRSRLGEGDAGTTLTRDRWLMPLFQELGYGRLPVAKPVMLEGKEYRISHLWIDTPIHLVGCGVNLDRRQPGVTGAAKSSPHSLVQEYLNRNPNQLWGLLSNGLTLRVLRDNASLTRQAYLEFDLEAMLTGEVYADFVVLWLVCHQSRLETQEGRPESCWLETWSKAAQEQGTRALDKLREGVEAAIRALGSGFIANPANTALKTKLRTGELTREGFYRQLLRLVYRLIFLFAAEDRELLLDPKASPAARERYMKYYSATRLRQIAEQSRGGKHPDLYATLRLVASILGGREKTDAGQHGLGLPVLGSFLFSGDALPDLETAQLENGALLSAVRGLAFILDGNTRRAVDYRNLGTRELGSVYESLLELHPVINMDAGTFELIIAAGNERKTTGSYYTAEDLIKVLLDSALDPVILQAIQRAGPSIEAQIAALLALKVCDPACGSGHFLIAAARRIALRLAQLRSGDEEPSPDNVRTALRVVIGHCIYGVDINPMSVELCRVNLWLESIEPGKPLSFLDAHIQCGDSLVGVAPRLDISQIPDDAFNPAFGDDKATASALKKRNKAERGGQMGLGFYSVEDDSSLSAWITEQTEVIEQLPEETAEQVGRKEQSYKEYMKSAQYRRRKLEYDLWTAAFFWKMEILPGSAGILAPTQEMLRHHRNGGTLPFELVHRVEELAEKLNFLHWELRFPQVFDGENPGFDCVLGNPPWERIKLQEEEFFGQRDSEISQAPSKAIRQKLIDQLVKTNPTLSIELEKAKHSAECAGKFIRLSNRFPLSAVGDVNTYPLFTELARSLIHNIGRIGIIVPTGIATDDSTKTLFGDLLKEKSLIAFYGMDNEAMIFTSIDHRNKFALLCIAGTQIKCQEPVFTFFCSRVSDLSNPIRRFVLTNTDFELLNPNTRTLPVFRTSDDAEITKKIYRKVPIIENEISGENPWKIRFASMFHMSNDSGLFISAPADRYVPLYEAKLMHLYDHRWATYEGLSEEEIRKGLVSEISFIQKKDPNCFIHPRFWVPINEVNSRVKNWNYDWLIGFRDISNAIVERTAIFCLLPKVGMGNSISICFPNIDVHPKIIACLLANFSSLIFDFVVRFKVGGVHLNFFIVKQFPALPPYAYSESDVNFISKRVLELVYTSHDMEPFAEDLNYQGGPFQWDEDHRALLRAELDAYYARLYGLTRNELLYILDPKDVYGSDFPGETFRVLKEKEIKQYGEYRTRRLVLDAWDRLDGVEPASQPIPVDDASISPVSPATFEKPIAWSVKAQKTAESVHEIEPSSQPMLSDFGMYKCGICEKIVMGFEKENHQEQIHSGISIEWKRIR